MCGYPGCGYGGGFAAIWLVIILIFFIFILCPGGFGCGPYVY